MKRSSRNVQPSSSNRRFWAIFASPNRYFTENSHCVSLHKSKVGTHVTRSCNPVIHRTTQVMMRNRTQASSSSAIKGKTILPKPFNSTCIFSYVQWVDKCTEINEGQLVWTTASFVVLTSCPSVPVDLYLNVNFFFLYSRNPVELGT